MNCPKCELQNVAPGIGGVFLEHKNAGYAQCIMCGYVITPADRLQALENFIARFTKSIQHLQALGDLVERLRQDVHDLNERTL